MTAEPTDAIFRFESPGLSVEFEGPEEWVTAQIAFFAARIQQEMGAELRRESVAPAAAVPDAAAPQPATGATGATATQRPPLSVFYETVRSREGRGALQEKILIFAYYLQRHRLLAEFTIDELNACFEQVGTEPPRNLANTLGIMKRTQQLFAAGSGRGHYTLTDKGQAYVERLTGAA